MLKLRKGFTLIELLIVVVIISILATIAIPKFANTKSKAYKTAMISDLRNLVTAEEAFFSDSGKYSTTIDSTHVRFAPSTRSRMSTGSSHRWERKYLNLDRYILPSVRNPAIDGATDLRESLRASLSC